MGKPVGGTYGGTNRLSETKLGEPMGEPMGEPTPLGEPGRGPQILTPTTPMHVMLGFTLMYIYKPICICIYMRIVSKHVCVYVAKAEREREGERGAG